MQPNGPSSGSGSAWRRPPRTGHSREARHAVERLAPPHSRRSWAGQARWRDGAEEGRQAGSAAGRFRPEANLQSSVRLAPLHRGERWPVSTPAVRASLGPTARRASRECPLGCGRRHADPEPDEGPFGCMRFRDRLQCPASACGSGRETSHGRCCGGLASRRLHSTRLETRTKECSSGASRGVVQTSRAQ